MLTKPSTIPFNKRTKRKLLFSSGIFLHFFRIRPTRRAFSRLRPRKFATKGSWTTRHRKKSQLHPFIVEKVPLFQFISEKTLILCRLFSFQKYVFQAKHSHSSYGHIIIKFFFILLPTFITSGFKSTFRTMLEM